MADLFKARKVPEVRKIPALLRLHGLNAAIIAQQKDTLAVGLFLQNQSATIRAQPHELLDEIVLAQRFELRQPGEFGVGHAHLARPATAGGATSAFVEDRHAASVGILDGSAISGCCQFQSLPEFLVALARKGSRVRSCQLNK